MCVRYAYSFFHLSSQEKTSLTPSELTFHFSSVFSKFQISHWVDYVSKNKKFFKKCGGKEKFCCQNTEKQSWY